MQIPRIDAAALFDTQHADHDRTHEAVRAAAFEVGFLTLYNTSISTQTVEAILEMYRQFFQLPEATKALVNMANTGSNRGWGAPHAEQVSPDANPDYKEVFDCGPELPANDPIASIPYYAPNRWPEQPLGFRDIIVNYYTFATAVALNLLIAIARAIGERDDYFEDKFDQPMALLRGNYYPPRPDYAGDKDFGIAPHTDYGCLTLLAMDGTPGLEVCSNSEWLPVLVPPGEFVINFGEMFEMWTEGRVVATTHRVIGGHHQRISVPLFFNPRHDVNVAPGEHNEEILAGDYLTRRYDETYLHQRNRLKT